MCIICGVDCEGAEFIGNKQTDEQTYRHPTLYTLYVVILDV